MDAVQAIVIAQDALLLCLLSSRPVPWPILPLSVVLTVENSRRLYAAVDQFCRIINYFCVGSMTNLHSSSN